MLEPVILESMTTFSQLTLAIVGAPKTGKTQLAATGRAPLLVQDYDLRSEALAGHKGIYAIKMVDPPHPLPQTVIPDTFDILTCIEKSKKLSEIVIGARRLFPDVDPSLELKTIVIDSADSLARASLNFILGSSPEIRYTVSVQGRFTNYAPKSWTGWVSDTAMVEQIVLRCIATGLDTIFVLHESPEEVETDEWIGEGKNEQRKTRFTGRITVFPVRYGKILKNFNEVWRMELVPDQTLGRHVPKVRVAQDWNFNASTCMLLDPVEPPNIANMIEKHARREASNAGAK